MRVVSWLIGHHLPRLELLLLQLDLVCVRHARPWTGGMHRAASPAVPCEGAARGRAAPPGHEARSAVAAPASASWLVVVALLRSSPSVPS